MIGNGSGSGRHGRICENFVKTFPSEGAEEIGMVEVPDFHVFFTLTKAQVVIINIIEG